MYQIVKDNQIIGYVENPVLTKYKEDVFISASYDEATFIYFGDTVYNILGKGEDEKFETVMLLPVDKGIVDTEHNIMMNDFLIHALS